MENRQSEIIDRAAVWSGCYDDSWQGLLTPESFAHPAKFARGLIERIIRHGLARGYWKAGDRLGDPFGGVATGGVIAGYSGLHWLGVELEPRFVALGGEGYECDGVPDAAGKARCGAVYTHSAHHCAGNLELHRPKWAALGYRLDVRLIRGDSRNFAALVAADGILTSPPFADIASGGPDHHADRLEGSGQSVKVDRYGPSEGQIGRLPAGSLAGVMTSPTYAEGLSHGGGRELLQPDMRRHDRNLNGIMEGYGDAPGQIGRLLAPSLAGIVTSPTYGETSPEKNSSGIDVRKQWEGYRARGGSMSFDAYAANQKKHSQGYGDAAGNIGNLKEGRLDAVVTSPPWEKNTEGGLRGSKFKAPAEALAAGRGHGATDAARLRQLARDEARTYGETSGQIGTLSGGALDTIVTSPPFSPDQPCNSQSKLTYRGDLKAPAKRHRGMATAANIQQLSPGEAVPNRKSSIVDHQSKETYWSAMATVYRQCWLALKADGVMAVVVKDYVKKGRRVPLCDDTLRLLEAVGFVPLERVRALLVRETTERCLFGSPQVRRRERKSFFRRLAEAKGSPRIDWEEVLFVRKGEEPARSR